MTPKKLPKPAEEPAEVAAAPLAPPDATDAFRERAKNVLTSMFLLPTEDIMDIFAKAPGARRGKDPKDFVFIPGTRPAANSVLLVAHADTVDKHPPHKFDIEWEGGVCYTSRFGKSVLGGDDRCGCAALWLLRNMGHPLLITNGEERGGIGAHAAARELGKDILGQYAFAIEIDRAGDEQMVDYPGCRSKALISWLTTMDEADAGAEGKPPVGGGLFAGWRTGAGSYTDIATLCAEAGIGGVNFAAGYFFNHSSSEIVVLDAWLRTFLRVHELLAREQLPRFEKDKAPPVSTYSYGYHGYMDWLDQDALEKQAEGRTYRPKMLWDTDVGASKAISAIPADVTMYGNYIRHRTNPEIWIYAPELIKKLQAQAAAPAPPEPRAKGGKGKRSKAEKRAEREARRAKGSDDAEDGFVDLSHVAAVLDEEGHFLYWLDRTVCPEHILSPSGTQGLRTVRLSALQREKVLEKDDWIEVAKRQPAGRRFWDGTFIRVEDLPVGISIFAQPTEKPDSCFLYVEHSELAACDGLAHIINHGYAGA